jgi:hypothetical protein
LPLQRAHGQAHRLLLPPSCRDHCANSHPAAAQDCAAAARTLPSNPDIQKFKACAATKPITDDCCKTVSMARGLG